MVVVDIQGNDAFIKRATDEEFDKIEKLFYDTGKSYFDGLFNADDIDLLFEEFDGQVVVSETI